MKPRTLARRSVLLLTTGVLLGLTACSAPAPTAPTVPPSSSATVATGCPHDLMNAQHLKNVKSSDSLVPSDVVAASSCLYKTVARPAVKGIQAFALIHSNALDRSEAAALAKALNAGAAPLSLPNGVGVATRNNDGRAQMIAFTKLDGTVVRVLLYPASGGLASSDISNDLYTLTQSGVAAAAKSLGTVPQS
jgi:hypothetical protein